MLLKCTLMDVFAAGRTLDSTGFAALLLGFVASKGVLAPGGVAADAALRCLASVSSSDMTVECL